MSNDEGRLGELAGQVDRALRPIGLGEEHAGAAVARAAGSAPQSLDIGDDSLAAARANSPTATIFL